MIPECELRVLLPRMLSQRADLRSQAAYIRAELEQALLMGWVPHGEINGAAQVGEFDLHC